MRDTVYMKWSNNFPLNYETLLGASHENTRKSKGKMYYTLYKMPILACLTVIATMHKDSLYFSKDVNVSYFV